MSWEILAVVLVGTLALMLLLGQWTAFALGFAGVLILYLGKGPHALLTLSSVVWNTANNYILIAVPLFLLMGEVVLRSGVSRYFYQGVAALLGPLPGGLLHANVLACSVFAAISGSSVATAASIGTVAIPEMVGRGYDRRLVFGSLAAGGTLGILIPPSIIMILYGALVQESVSRLFMAGLLPGVALSALFMLYLAVRVTVDPTLAPVAERERLPAAERMRQMLHVLPVLALMGVVLGGIYSGVTTPTEAAAVGALGAIVLAVCYGGLTRKTFGEALLATVRTTCMVTFIIIGAQLLSTSLSYSGITRAIGEGIVGLELSRWVLFTVLVVLYLALGCVVDGISMIYLTLPVLLPVVQAAAFDLVWFGVVLTILVEVGQITPPVGLNLFTIQGISGGRPLSEVVAGSAPFVVLILLMIGLLALVPQLALWLPSAR